MTEPDPLPRPPRRRINGVTWVYPNPGRMGVNGILLLMKRVNHTDMFRFGFAMGCVKDDDGELPDLLDHVIFELRISYRTTRDSRIGGP